MPSSALHVNCKWLNDTRFMTGTALITEYVALFQKWGTNLTSTTCWRLPTRSRRRRPGAPRWGLFLLFFVFVSLPSVVSGLLCCTHLQWGWNEFPGQLENRRGLSFSRVCFSSSLKWSNCWEFYSTRSIPNLKVLAQTINNNCFNYRQQPSAIKLHNILELLFMWPVRYFVFSKSDF